MGKARISARLRRRVTEQAQHRYGYCQCSEMVTGMPLEIDHIIPEAAGGSSSEENLWLACVMCNKIKGTQTHARDLATARRVRLFNPQKQVWRDHFKWSTDGTEIIGKTPCGRATVIALQLNRHLLIIARRHWITADLHPPKES